MANIITIVIYWFFF